MANLIQIKRSLTTAVPTSLANGELAYTAAGDVLYIGSNGAVVAIGGARTPGILTANQALVANSTGWMDNIKVDNLTVTNITANGTSGPAGTVLASDGDSMYWLDLTQVSVGPSYVQNTDSRVMSGNLHFTGANTTIDNLTVSSSVIKGVNPTITLGGDLSGTVTLSNLANGTLTASLTKVLTLGTDTDGDYVATISTGDGLSGSGSGEGSTPTIAVVAGIGVTANSTGVHIGQPVATTDSVTFQDVTVNGNTTLGNASSDTITPTGRFAGSLVPSANVSYDLGTANLRWRDLYLSGSSIVLGDAQITSGAGNTVNVGNIGITDTLTVNTAQVYGNLTVGGDLVVTGNLAIINVSTLAVEDALIRLAVNNSVSDSLDIGFFGEYNGGTGVEYTGLFRDASDAGKFKLFTGLDTEPGLTVDTADSSFTTGTLKAWLDSGTLQTTSSGLTITATASESVTITANTLTLSSALATGSGGTGQSTYALGDLLVGTSGGSLTKLAVGSEGYVLQSNGTALVYGTLDGGTF
jgi:hypothetical protein